MSTSWKLEKGRINCRPRPPTLPGTVEPMPIIASTTLSLGACWHVEKGIEATDKGDGKGRGVEGASTTAGRSPCSVREE